MKFYFCYEQGTTGLWSPVLYHNEPPSKRERRNATEVVAYDSPEEPSFATMMRIFPLERYITVVRPVEGFQTKDGKFYESEVEAEIHETTYSISKAFYEFVEGSNVARLPADQKDVIVTEALRFMHENRTDIIRYLQCTKQYEEMTAPPPPTTDAVAEDEKIEAA